MKLSDYLNVNFPEAFLKLIVIPIKILRADDLEVILNLFGSVPKHVLGIKSSDKSTLKKKYRERCGEELGLADK